MLHLDQAGALQLSVTGECLGRSGDSESYPNYVRNATYSSKGATPKIKRDHSVELPMERGQYPLEANKALLPLTAKRKRPPTEAGPFFVILRPLRGLPSGRGSHLSRLVLRGPVVRAVRADLLSLLSRGLRLYPVVRADLRAPQSIRSRLSPRSLKQLALEIASLPPS